MGVAFLCIIFFALIIAILYSIRRPGVFKPDTPEEKGAAGEEKVKRLERLKKEYEKYLPDNNKKMIGKIYRVLVEGKSKNNNKLYTGRTSQNKVVIFEAKEEDVGKIVDVKIVSEHLWYLKGEIV